MQTPATGTAIIIRERRSPGATDRHPPRAGDPKPLPSLRNRNTFLPTSLGPQTLNPIRPFQFHEYLGHKTPLLFPKPECLGKPQILSQTKTPKPFPTRAQGVANNLSILAKSAQKRGFSQTELERLGLALSKTRIRMALPPTPKSQLPYRQPRSPFQGKCPLKSAQNTACTRGTLFVLLDVSTILYT
jgi:hypothetical protein